MQKVTKKLISDLKKKLTGYKSQDLKKYLYSINNFIVTYQNITIRKF